MTPTTPLPPLPPPRLEDLDPAPPPRSRLPLIAAAAALVLAGVFALLWLSARSSNDDTAAERDAALAERDVATQSNIDTNAQLRTAEDELADARDALDEESGSGGAGSAGADDEELQELKDRAEELSAEVDRLEEENDALTTELEGTAPPVAATEEEPGATATTPATTTPETATSVTTEPEDPTPDTTVFSTLPFVDIGDQISRLFRPSVLGTLQKTCIGEFVVEDLGEERVLAAIASESPEDDEEFIDVVSAAADFCSIDRSAIFG